MTTTQKNVERLPPHNLDAERSVLGSMLRDNAVIDDVLLLVRQGHFYTDAHQKVFAALAALHTGRCPADLVTLANELARRKELEDVGGYSFLGELWDAAPTAANAVHYSKIVREKGMARALIRSCNALLRDAYDQTRPAEELVEQAEKEVFALAEDAVGDEEADAAQVVNEVYDCVDAYHSDQSGAGGLTTGFLDLDARMGALQPSSLVLLAARPSVGKTALATAFALNAALDGRPVFFASLEQTRKELMERMLCSKAKVDSHALRKGMLDDAAFGRFHQAGDEIRNAPLVIDDASRQTVLRIQTKARRLKRREGLAAVVVDYLQLIVPTDRRAQRYEQVGEISRGLKAMAKDLEVPVIAACQLNRSPEGRADKEPRLSDLRESGSLEMDADVVVLLSRSEHERNVIELDLAKNRNGPTGRVKLLYRPQWTRFENYAAGVPLPA
jgi:replicative DNA helicase